MSALISETRVAFGRVPALTFAATGFSGDWRRWSVQFPTPFLDDAVRVIATANDENSGSSSVVPVVPIILDSNRNGFTVAARNSDVVPGSAGINWIALREQRGTPTGQALETRLLQTTSREFRPSGQPRDWHRWLWQFAAPMSGTPIVIAGATRTAWDYTDDRLDIIGGGVARRPSKATPVGIARQVSPAGATISARNTSVTSGFGSRAMQAIAISGGTGLVAEPQIAVDSGLTQPIDVTWLDTSIPRYHVEIEFNAPFNTPPLVFFCATNVGTPNRDEPPALSGWVAEVTCYSFKLFITNTDLTTGFAAFHWVAFGCAFGCGGLPRIVPFSSVASLTPRPMPPINVGKSVQASVTARDAAEREVPNPMLRWSTNNPAVASVSETGNITGVSKGDAVIRIESGEVSAELKVEVVAK